ncbi:hypothetical protein ACPJHQ_25880 [Rossellomorea sp. H39__3]
MLLRKYVEEKTGLKTIELDNEPPSVVRFHVYFCQECGIHTAVDQRLEDHSGVECSSCRTDDFLIDLPEELTMEGTETV